MLLWSFVLFQISAISISVSVLEQLQPIQLFPSQLVTSSDKFGWDIPPALVQCRLGACMAQLLIE